MLWYHLVHIKMMQCPVVGKLGHFCILDVWQSVRVNVIENCGHTIAGYRREAKLLNSAVDKLVHIIYSLDNYYILLYQSTSKLESFGTLDKNIRCALKELVLCCTCICINSTKKFHEVHCIH